MLSNVKTKSQSNVFTHFSPDRVWSVSLTSVMSHTNDNMNLQTFMEYRANSMNTQDSTQEQQQQEDFSTSSARYVYLTRRFRNPSLDPILQEIAPVMSTSLPLSKGVESEISLWLSSGNTTVSPHYDMEHNFFLQVNGTKKFIIASPLHYPMFQPYSSLHPRWRQGRAVHLTSVDAIHEHLANTTNCVDYSSRNKACKASCSSSSSSDVCTDPAVAAVTVEQEKGRYKVGYGVHEVVLTAGQMLYLPPFYFHSVSTLDPYSVSINSWIGSKYLTAANKLSTNVPLPYPADATEDARVLTIGALINLVLIRLGRHFTPNEFVVYLKSRVKNIHFDSDSHVGANAQQEEECVKDTFSCNDTFPFSVCSDRKIALQGTIHSISYHAVYS